MSSEQGDAGELDEMGQMLLRALIEEVWWETQKDQAKQDEE